MTVSSLFKLKLLKLSQFALALCALGSLPIAAIAGGPKFVAGVTYFNPGVLGQPVIWANGQVTYSVDQGSLNSTVSNQRATAIVDAAAAIWSAVPTAAISLIDGGSLAEDVTGANVQAVGGIFAAPGDVTPSATNTPLAVIFDADGSVIDALEGTGASLPTNCTQNSVLVWIDNLNPNATLAHGVIVMNGRCATTNALLSMMSFQLERAFGRVLGLDFAQVNDGSALSLSSDPSAILAWPVMEPLSGECGAAGGSCIPNENMLRFDDIATLNRLYPVTAANQSSFQGKVLTAANTISLKGTISFRDGSGMQGVNVVARPLDGNGNLLYQYTVTFVSGSYFAGNHGNPISGWLDPAGNRLDRFGSSNASLQGLFDLSGMPLPPGMASVNYQVTFESVNPLYINSLSVGPYLQGSPSPSGTLQTVAVNGLAAGSSQTVAVQVANSASGEVRNGEFRDGVSTSDESRNSGLSQVAEATQTVRGHAILSNRPIGSGSAYQPVPLSQTGMWTSRLGLVGASDWFLLPVRGNRIFTVVTQALDETGAPSASKAMPALGVWDGFLPVGSAAPGFTTAGNGEAVGETWLQVATSGKDIVRLGVADQRGDGRPDYLYRGWVLYADTVSPARLPAAGGQIVIHGTGFRQGDTVQVGGVAATVTSILPTEITAIVAAAPAITGSVDVEVDDLPWFNALAIIPGGISFDSAAGDGINLVTAPQGQIPLNVPQPFSVLVLGSDGNPAGNVTVTYSLTSGAAALGCGNATCSVTSTGDGRATLMVTATNMASAVVTVTLTNGSSIQAHFYGGVPANLTALTSTLYLAAGSSVSWPVQALVQSSGVPVAGQQVTWQSGSGISAATGAFASNSAGIAAASLTVGPLAEGQTAISNACLAGNVSCAAFTAFGARPEFASIAAVSGTSQSMAIGTAAATIAMRVLDMNGHPMAGATVTISQTLFAWSAPCPRHGRCAAAQLLTSAAATLTSALDGSISFTPLSLAGIPTSLVGIAATGNTGTLSFTVEQHP